jgi:hypothetical protein
MKPTLRYLVLVSATLSILFLLVFLNPKRRVDGKDILLELNDLRQQLRATEIKKGEISANFASLQKQFDKLKEQTPTQDKTEDVTIKQKDTNEIPWLLVGIPTVLRPRGVDYLAGTLDALVQQIPSDDTNPFYGEVRSAFLSITM